MTDLQSHTTPELARCSCGHRIVEHRLMPSTRTLPKRRGECSAQDAAPVGKCQCKGPR